MSAETTVEVGTEASGRASGSPRGPGPQRMALVVAWSAAEPERVGESLLVHSAEPVVLGREGDAGLVRQRPDKSVPTGGLEDPTISRRQLEVRLGGRAVLHVENVGRGKMFVDGEAVDEARLQPGSVVELRDRLVLLASRRPSRLEESRSFPMSQAPRFGAADRHGLVGESPLAWALREQAALVARLPHHVLILGDSGAGKELLAKAVHALSPRRDRSLVSRNAATIPPGIAAAELFGSAKNYPQSGMASRPGLVGTAHGGTLFLDEVGELPLELQAQLLRVLDASGEYQRLGEVRVRQSDLRVVAATNRDVDELRHDLAPRFKLRLVVPGLNDRREDIGLLIRHLLAGAFRADAGEGGLAERFLEEGDLRRPRVSTELVAALVQHRYTHHVRELDGYLWRALTASSGGRVVAPPGLIEGLDRERPGVRESTPPEEVSREQIEALLQEHEGAVSKVYKELGLSSRFVLRRLMIRFGLDAADYRPE